MSSANIASHCLSNSFTQFWLITGILIHWFWGAFQLWRWHGHLRSSVSHDGGRHTPQAVTCQWIMYREYEFAVLKFVWTAVAAHRLSELLSLNIMVSDLHMNTVYIYKPIRSSKTYSLIHRLPHFIIAHLSTIDLFSSKQELLTNELSCEDL